VTSEYTGRGSIGRLGSILESLRSRTVFLVTGKGSYAASGARTAVEPFLAARRVVHFTEFSPNPTGEDVRRGVAEFRRANADIVIAIGGGSAIDMAKVVNLCGCHDGDPADYIARQRSFSARGLAVVAIPTTAGSGAEATHFASVYLDGVKQSPSDERMRPTHVILDADLTMSVPPVITASTGIDALAQAIESYWSVGATEESRRYAREAVQRAAGTLAGAVHENTAWNRDEMIVAANLAGKAIDVSRTTAPHALSYKLTSDFGLLHGHAVGMTLGPMFEFNSRVADADSTHPRGAEFTRARISELCELLDCADAAGVRDRLRDLMISIGLETRLGRLGVKRSDLPELARAVNDERLANNPRKVPPSALRAILETVY